MKSPNMIVLYIENMSLSRAFYARLFGLEPVQASDGFTLYLLEGGFKFALWAVQAVVPATAVTGGGVEIDFSVEAREEVDALYATGRSAARDSRSILTTRNSSATPSLRSTRTAIACG
jgi:catechol 2,3-dioxygenase-like lactoylglutathione lyase family enzyme